MAVVERRYAEALADLAMQKDAADIYERELRALTETCSGQDRLARFLRDKSIGMDIKKAAVDDILTDIVDSGLVNFIKVLIDLDRIKHLPGIYEEYKALVDRRRNVLSITVCSPLPLDGRQLERIKEKYRKRYGSSSVKAEVITDPGLIGGIKIKAGDVLTDASLKRKLKDLEQFITDS